MRFLLFFLLLFVLIVLQISVFPHFQLRGVFPNIVLAVVIFLAYYQQVGKINYWELMAFSFVSGVLLDAYSGLPFGIILISFIVIVASVNFVVDVFSDSTHSLIIGLAIFFGSAGYFFINLGIIKLYEIFKIMPVIDTDVATMLKAAVFYGILNIFVSVIIYLPIDKFLAIIDSVSQIAGPKRFNATNVFWK